MQATMRHHVTMVCRGVENTYLACPLSFSESWKPQIYANFYITRLQLEKSCPARTPDFIVTATRSFSVYNGTITLQVVTNTVNDSGGVSTFTVYTNLSSTDDSCLILQISAGNSAGISAPTEVAFRESDSIYTQALRVLRFSHIIIHPASAWMMNGHLHLFLPLQCANPLTMFPQILLN